MRLVKELRRRFSPAAFLCCAVPVVCWGAGACADEKPLELSADDCAPTLRLPSSPRIMEVAPDGSVHPGPACATANCLAGAAGAWGYRDATSTKIRVGARDIELPAAPDAPPPSRLAAQHALRGFVLSRGLVAIDRGAELEVATAEGSTRVPMPALDAHEELQLVWRLDGGLFAAVLHTTTKARRTLVLVPMKSAPPQADASPIFGDTDAIEGWLLPSPDDVTPASLQLASGERVRLPMSLPSHASARSKAGWFHVGAGKRSWLVSRAGAVVAELQHGQSVQAHAGTLYVVDGRPPGAVHTVSARGLEPLLVPAAGFDLAGERVPEGARIERIQVRTEAGHALLIERRRARTCTVEDRLMLVDLAKKSARTIATGDVVRLHPTFAGDRFRFVEADARYE